MDTIILIKEAALKQMFDAHKQSIVAEISSLLGAVQQTGTAAAADAKETKAQPLTEAERLTPPGWPESGTVTIQQICKSWGVSRSTYMRKKDAGKYPEPLGCIGTIANRYSATAVRDAFLAEMLTLNAREAVRKGARA